MFGIWESLFLCNLFDDPFEIFSCLMPNWNRECEAYSVLFLFCVNWRHLSVEKNRVLFVKLFPEISNLTRDNPPIASFIVRVVSSVGDRKSLTHPGHQCSDFLFLFHFFLWIENIQSMILVCSCIVEYIFFEQFLMLTDWYFCLVQK